MSEASTKARCSVCCWPLFVHPGRAPCAAPAQHEKAPTAAAMPLPIKGVRVDRDKVIVSVSGGNDAARFVCGALIAMHIRPAAPADEKTCSYPRCECPFDAPADPNWCARGWPRTPRAAAPWSNQ